MRLTFFLFTPVNKFASGGEQDALRRKQDLLFTPSGSYYAVRNCLNSNSRMHDGTTMVPRWYHGGTTNLVMCVVTSEILVMCAVMSEITT